MTRSLNPRLAFGCIVAIALSVAPAHAQTRTWVSGVGDDANPCSRTAPCKTFAGAISKTAAGGEISVLDPGGYGPVTINKALTINGEGTLTSIVMGGSGTAINVAAGASDQVILRNLTINGAGGGNDGIFISSGNVTIDKCFIYGFTSGFFGGLAVNITASGSLNVDIRDTALSNNSCGVAAQTTSGTVTVSLDNVHITAAPVFGVVTLSSGVLMSVRNSYIKNAGTAVNTNSGTSTITLDHSELTNNSTAVNASAVGSTIRMTDVSMYDNSTGVAFAAGATVASANNNHSQGNTTSTAPNGTVSTF